MCFFFCFLLFLSQPFFSTWNKSISIFLLLRLLAIFIHKYTTLYIECEEFYEFQLSHIDVRNTMFQLWRNEKRKESNRTFFLVIKIWSVNQFFLEIAYGCRHSSLEYWNNYWSLKCYNCFWKICEGYYSLSLYNVHVKFMIVKS